MYYVDGELRWELPERIRLPDGKTRTGLHKLPPEDLPQYGIHKVDTIDKPGISWTQRYGEPEVSIDGVFARVTYPVVDYSEDEVANILLEAKVDGKARIAAMRFDMETAGLEGVRTDRESQALITGAALKAMQDSGYSCRWKTEAGFVELSAQEILGIADAVREHVQSCFDWEADECVKIDEATTPMEVDEICREDT